MMHLWKWKNNYFLNICVKQLGADSSSVSLDSAEAFKGSKFGANAEMRALLEGVKCSGGERGIAECE